MDDPRRGKEGYLRIADMLGISEPHKYAVGKKRRAGNGNENYLCRRRVKEDREDEARNITRFNNYELPQTFCVLRKEQTFYKVAKIEESAAVSTDEHKVQKEHKSAGTLHYEKRTVFLALEGRNDYEHSEYS